MICFIGTKWARNIACILRIKNSGVWEWLTWSSALVYQGTILVFVSLVDDVDSTEEVHELPKESRRVGVHLVLVLRLSGGGIAWSSNNFVLTTKMIW